MARDKKNPPYIKKYSSKDKYKSRKRKRTVQTAVKIRGENSINLEEDLSNYSQFYLIDGQGSVYIHNRSRNFSFVADLISKNLNLLTLDLTNSWKKDAEELIKITKERKEAFFSSLNSELSSGNMIDEKNFFDLFQAFSTQQIMDWGDALNKIKNNVKGLPNGDKTYNELLLLRNELNKLSAYVVNTLGRSAGVIDESFITSLKKAQNTVNKFFIKWADKSDGGNRIDFSNDKGITDEPAIGILRKKQFNTYLLPLGLESQITALFGEWIASLIGSTKKVWGTGSKGNIGTTSDFIAKINNVSVGFSVKSKRVQQTKRRKLDTFFNFNDILNKDKKFTIRSIQGFSNSQDLVKMFNYLIQNYIYLDVKDPELLQEFSNFLILINLNEKLFGYNKSDQEKGVSSSKISPISWSDLLEQWPIATFTENSIEWMDEFLEQLMNDILSKKVSINSLGTVTINSNQNFDPKKDSYWVQKRQSVRLNAKDGKLKYANLIKDLKGSIAFLNKQIKDAIKVEIKYKFRS